MPAGKVDIRGLLPYSYFRLNERVEWILIMLEIYIMTHEFHKLIGKHLNATISSNT